MSRVIHLRCNLYTLPRKMEIGEAVELPTPIGKGLAAKLRNGLTAGATAAGVSIAIVTHGGSITITRTA